MILKLLFGVDSVKDIKKQINSVLNIINASNATKNILPSFTGLELQEKSVKAYAAAIKGLNVAQAESVLSTTMLTSAQQAQVLSEASLLTTTNALTAEQQEQLLTSGLITSEQMAQIASTLGLTTAEGGALVATEALNLENIKLQLTDMGIIGTTQAKIIEMLGLTAAEGAATGATGLLTKAVLALHAAWLANPAGVILAGIGAIAAVVVGAVGAFHLYNNSVNGMIKKNQKLIDSNKEVYDSILEEEKTFTDNANGLKDAYENYLTATKGSEEYYNAINKIAEISPELVVGYDNEGNAILANNEVIKEQIEYYKQLAEEKRNAARTEALENLDEETKSYQDLVSKKDSKQKQYNEAKSTLDSYEKVIKKNESGEALSDSEKILLDEAITSVDSYRLTVQDLKKDLEDLSNQLLTSSTQLRTWYTSLLDTVDRELTEEEKTLRQGLIDTAIKEGFSYEQLDSVDDLFLSNGLVQKAAKEIINLDDNLSDEEYRKQAMAIYQKLADQFALTDEAKKAFQVAFGIDQESYNNAKETRNNNLNLVHDKIVANRLNLVEGNEINNWAKTLSDEDLQIVAGLTFDKDTTLEELKKLLDEAKGVVENFDLSKALSFSQQMQGIHKLSEGLDQLDSIMADVIDGENFDYSSILEEDGDFYNTFHEFTDEYEKFIETITNSPDDITKCQDAFDELATAYVYSKDALQDLSRETQNAAILELDQMGIENAEEVVTNMLSGYEEAMQLAEAANIDFANATAEEIYSLQGLEAEFANAGEAAFNYYLRKKLVSEGSINTVADINALIALAQQCQVTGKNLELLIKLRNIYNVIESDMWGDATKKLAAEEASKLTAELMTLSVTTAKFAGGAQTAAAKQEKLADATDKATDALEKEKEKLEDLKNEYDELYDAIQWYYDKQIDKIDKKIDALNDENEALEKQQENMDKILAAIESNYDAEIKLIQDKIDALQDENDEEERALALEEAKRKLQEAKSRKTLMVYQKGVGFTYQVDSKSIKEAEDELEELQENEVVSELEKQIEKLEEAKEKWSEIPDAYEKAMQEIAAMNYFGKNWKDITLNPSDELLNSFEGKYTGIQSSIEKNESRIESYEKEKEAIEELKQAWEDAKNAYQYSQYEAKLSSFFGSDYEYQLLHNSAGWRRKFADEYSSICSQIEALEERIKASNESTASSTEESAGRVAGAAKKVGESTKDIKFEIDNTALEEAKLKLEQLDYQISTGQQGLETARNAVANFIKQYEAADGCTTITEELSKSVDELGRIYGGTGDKMADTISGISSDIETFKVQSQTMSQNLTDVDEKLQSISNSESQVESNVNAELSEVDQTILNLKKNIDDLKLALQELETFKTNLNTLVTEQVLDTSVLTADTMARVTEIQTAVSTLFVSIGTLGNALETLSGQMQTLDSYTLNNLIMSLGQGGEEGGSGLFAAIQNIITLISNEETGLLTLLGRVNTSDLTAIIASFNGEAGLLPAITAVSSAIFVEGDEDGASLYSVINKLIETIPTITSVRSSFSELVGTLAVCNSQVNSLQKAIDELPTEKTITINVVQNGTIPEGTGTAFAYGTGSAKNVQSGNAYSRGTWGLPTDQPDSLVGELGTEIVVRDGQYFTVDSPTIMDLEKDDIVFNHKQTEAILRNGKKSIIDTLSEQSKSVYTKLTGSSFAKGTMNENVFNAIMHGLQFAMNPVNMMPKFAHGINSIPEVKNEQNFNVTIGDIYLNGVQDTNGLARAIKDKLPRLMVQELSKR